MSIIRDNMIISPGEKVLAVFDFTKDLTDASIGGTPSVTITRFDAEADSLVVDNISILEEKKVQCRLTCAANAMTGDKFEATAIISETSNTFTFSSGLLVIVQ